MFTLLTIIKHCREYGISLDELQETLESLKTAEDVEKWLNEFCDEVRPFQAESLHRVIANGSYKSALRIGRIS